MGIEDMIGNIGITVEDYIEGNRALESVGLPGRGRLLVR